MCLEAYVSLHYLLIVINGICEVYRKCSCKITHPVQCHPERLLLLSLHDGGTRDAGNALDNVTEGSQQHDGSPSK